MLQDNERSRKAIVTRDPDHCIDLGAKSLAAVPFMETVLNDAKSLLRFVRIDRITGIKEKLIARGVIQPCPPAHIHPDTRMYLGHDTFASVLGQRPFVGILGGNAEYGEYHSSRPTAG